MSSRGGFWGSQPDQGRVGEELDFHLSFPRLHISAHALPQLGQVRDADKTDHVRPDLGQLQGGQGSGPSPTSGGKNQELTFASFCAGQFYPFCEYLTDFTAEVDVPRCQGQ